MALINTYDGGVITHKVAPSGISLTHRADMGEASFGGIPIEDPAASLTMVGHKTFTVEEDDCAQPRLFTGWTTERGIGRDLDLGMFVGPSSRVHDTTIVDLNALFSFRQITGTDGNRPDETWEDRLDWILNSDYLDGLISTSRTFTDTWPNPMDAADYRGSNPSAVLDDLAQRFDGAVNYFAFWDPAGSAVTLFFDHIAQGIALSTLSISNVYSDVDNSTCFAPDSVAVLQREPDQTYSEVVVEYSHGTLKLFRKRPSTEAAYIRRGTTISRPYTGKLSTATAQAEQWLDAHSVETDRITCSIRVPSSAAGLIQAGQTIAVRFSHMPGYESGATMRVVSCSPKPTDDTGYWYTLALELVGAPPSVGGQAAFGFSYTFYPELPRVTTPGNLLLAIYVANGYSNPPDEPVFVNGDGSPATYPWTVVGWTTAWDSTQYGGPGSPCGVGIAWRRVAVGEVTRTPCHLLETGNDDHGAVWLYEFNTTGEPGASTYSTTDPGKLSEPGTFTIGTALSGYTLGAAVIQEPDYMNEVDPTPVHGSIIYSGAADNSGVMAPGYYWGVPGVYIAGDMDGPISFGCSYQVYAPAYITGWGVAGIAVELPFISSLPAIPYPANVLTFIAGGGGGGGGGSDVIVPLPPAPGSTTMHTTDPAVTDDTAAGYTVGSSWVNETDGGVFVLVDATAGAAVWVETSGGGTVYAPTTADYLVGTAQGGLSAEIVVGTTPGGELGGTWASPTVDATHSGSAHLALGSTSSTAAAGDHAHVAAGTGELLITDTPAGSPLIFDDILQNDAGTDLLYADE